MDQTDGSGSDWWKLHFLTALSVFLLVVFWGILLLVSSVLPDEESVVQESINNPFLELGYLSLGLAVLFIAVVLFVFSLSAGMLSIFAYYFDAKQMDGWSPNWKLYVFLSLVLTPYTTAPIYVLHRNRYFGNIDSIKNISFDWKPVIRPDRFSWRLVGFYTFISYFSLFVVVYSGMVYCGDGTCFSDNTEFYVVLIALSFILPVFPANALATKIGSLDLENKYLDLLFKPTREQAVSALILYLFAASLFVVWTIFLKPPYIGVLLSDVTGAFWETGHWVYPVVVLLLPPLLFESVTSFLPHHVLLAPVSFALSVSSGIILVLLGVPIWVALLSNGFRKVSDAFFDELRTNRVAWILPVAFVVFMLLSYAYLNVTVPFGRQLPQDAGFTEPKPPAQLTNDTARRTALEQARANSEKIVMTKVEALKPKWVVEEIDPYCYWTEIRHADVEGIYVETRCLPAYKITDEWSVRELELAINTEPQVYLINTTSIRKLEYPLHNGYIVKPGANLSYADLSGLDMREKSLYGANLTGAVLYGSDIKYSNLSQVDLWYANMSGSSLDSTSLAWANLDNLNLSNSDLIHVNFSYSSARHSDFSGSYMSWVDFTRADLRDADMRSTILDGESTNEFRYADLRGVNFSNANGSAFFEGAMTRNCTGCP